MRPGKARHRPEGLLNRLMDMRPTIPCKYQRGATLLEALISMLIFSLGIIALMGLQAVSIGNTLNAKFRADAAFLADQLIGRMWADNPDPANLSTYAHHPGGTNCNFSGGAATNPYVGAGTPVPPAGTWLLQVQKLLPGATPARQQIVVGGDNTVTVTLCWQAARETAPHSFTAMAQINR